MNKMLCAIVAVILLSGCSSQNESSASDQNPYESKFEVYSLPYGKLLIDKETGCQYIRGNYGESSYTPRLTAEGKPMCGIPLSQGSK